MFKFSFCRILHAQFSDTTNFYLQTCPNMTFSYQRSCIIKKKTINKMNFMPFEFIKSVAN